MKTIVKKWRVGITLYAPVEFSYDDGDTEQSIREWLKSPNGKDYIADLFPKRIKDSSKFKYAEAEVESIDDIELKEYEVSSYDTDPRV